MFRVLAMHPRELRVQDLDAAAFVIVSAAEGVAMKASPEFYRGRGADELASLLTRYLTKRPMPAPVRVSRKLVPA